ncbi:hypothetical protein AAGW17_01365 [Rickettsia sp. Oklahoma-10]|uniref:Proline/betaine transporter n=1 Tax=Rickettsia oklahomensis TaxID=3141789 RepID=A0AAU7BYR0_9RICK
MCDGMPLGRGTAAGFSYFISAKMLFKWVWKIPFIAGLFISSIGLYIRKHLAESPIYKKVKESGRLTCLPLREILTKYPKELIVAFGIYITVTTAFYTSTVFISNFMQTLGYSQQSTILSSIILIVMMVLPILAYIPDKIGRRLCYRGYYIINCICL